MSSDKHVLSNFKIDNDIYSDKTTHIIIYQCDYTTNRRSLNGKNRDTFVQKKIAGDV